MSWTLVPIKNYSQFKSQWDMLNTSTYNTPLMESDFIEPLLNHFSAGNEQLAIYGDTNSPDAMAIIEKKKLGRWSTFQPSQAPIGCWLQKDTLSAGELSSSLLKSLPGIKLSFSIFQQDPDLLDRPDNNSGLSTFDYIETAWIDVEGIFDEYWNERSKNTRQNLRRQGNRLVREEIETRLEVITDVEKLKKCIEDYSQLESAGWKNEINTAISMNNSQGRFYLEMLTNFFNTGKGVIFKYWYNDTLTATDLCIFNAGSLIFLKTTYDESIKTTSPAMLMHKDAFEFCFNEKLTKKIEFYGKVMDWHTKFTKNSRTLYHTSCYFGLTKLVKKII